ncbi:MAG: YicC/YloC family endoribonuclease [Gemmatimonadales bacterium]
MTGFGSADGSVLGGRLRVDIRTVNHRYFNPQFKLPAELAGVEGELRERLRALFERGHVAVTARWVEPPASPADAAVAVDVVRARQVVAALKDLKKRLKLKGEPDLAFVARQPDVLTVGTGAGGGAGAGRADGNRAASWGELQPIVDQAARDVLTMREREGRALSEDLRARLDALETGAQRVADRAPVRLAAEYERLKKVVAELVGGVKVDEQRLALEIALMADRVDIAEELVRFRTHLAACREALAGDGAVGKQLGFLAQELLRETNTIGSKANDAAITQAVIAMKGELERFREQLENLE